jgi:hypothetical protein
MVYKIPSTPMYGGRTTKKEEHEHTREKEPKLVISHNKGHIFAHSLAETGKGQQGHKGLFNLG